MKSKYTRNSLIHQALESLDRLPRSPELLRTNLASISIFRFNEAVTDPLLKDKLASLQDGVLHLTGLGKDKLAELGATKAKLPSVHKLALSKDPYLGAELKVKPVRPGADQHESFPSRVGGELRYRDGRVGSMS
jgi:hypothetical protein